jgi:AMP deaminase
LVHEGITDMACRLGRYATYDPNAEKKNNKADLALKAQNANIPSASGTEAPSGVATPTSGVTHRSTSNVAADAHISGSDPMIFPGILSRDSSRRNLAKMDSWGVQSADVSSPGTD